MANEFIIRNGFFSKADSNITGSLSVSGSTTIYKSGSTVLDVQGSLGQLFSVTDSLTGDLFAVSGISGIPILNVNSNGTSSFDGVVFVDGIIQKSGSTSDDILLGDGSTTSLSGIGIISGSGVDNYVPRYDDTDGLQTSSIYVNDSGNVGIGTTSPTYPLVVNKVPIGSGIIASFEGDQNSAIRIARTGASQPGQTLLNVMNNGSFGIVSDSNVVIDAGGSTRFYVRGSDGNVGIGTTSPAGKLHVSGGNAIIEGATTIGAFSSKVKTIDSSTYGIWLGVATSGARPSVYNKMEVGNSTGFTHTHPNSTTHLLGSLPNTDFSLLNIQKITTAGASVNRYYLSLRDEGGILRMAFNGAGNLLVGVTDPGTQSTGDRLQVSGNGLIDGDLTVTGIITAQEFHTEFVSSSIIYQSGSTKFGDTDDDTHEFTGSVQLSGSIDIIGDTTMTGDLTLNGGLPTINMTRGWNNYIKASGAGGQLVFGTNGGTTVLTLRNDYSSIFGGAVTASAFTKTGATSDDILLGDGTTTSLSGIDPASISGLVSGSSQINYPDISNIPSGIISSSFVAYTNVANTFTQVQNLSAAGITWPNTTGTAWQLKSSGTNNEQIYWTYISGGLDERWMYLDAKGNLGSPGIRFRPGNIEALYLSSVNQSATFASSVTGTRFTSTQTTGTAPLTVASTTLVTNLNADLLDGVQGSNFLRSDEVGIKTAGDLKFNDTIQILLGNSSDAHLYHNGFNNLLDMYNGDFIIRDNSTSRFTFGRTTGNLTISGGLVIEGSIASSGTDYGYYQNAGTNIILKGDSSGRSGIFFQSEKNGVNINHPSDFGFLQFHSYGYGGATGESNALVLGVANDSTDIVVLQSPYKGGVKIGYKDATSGTDLILGTVWHSANDGSGSGLDADTLDGVSWGNVNTNIITSGDLTVNGGNIYTGTNTATRVKVGVYTDSTYGMGINSFTYGGLSELAITFQTSNTANRGFWWGDSTHTTAQGAMALTTEGKLTVAHSMRLGYGEADTTTPGASYKLDVSGTGRFTGIIYNDIGEFHSGVDDWELYNNSRFALRTVSSTAWTDNVTSDFLQWGQGTSGYQVIAGRYAQKSARTILFTSLFQVYPGPSYSTAPVPIGVFEVHDGTTNLLNVRSSGNVSIGNTNDTYKLDVSGTGRFTDDVTVSGSVTTQEVILTNASNTPKASMIYNSTDLSIDFIFT